MPYLNFLGRDPPTYDDDEPDGDEPEDLEPIPDGYDEHVAGGCVVLVPIGGVPWW
jgi:hypothetical protein